MEKLILQVALFRRGVERFEAEVNEHLEDGWTTEDLTVEKRGLRIICKALLWKKDEDEGEAEIVTE